MRFENKITVELNETDAAIASVLLAETAVRLALDALLADKTAEIGGTTNKGSRALADAYINVGQACHSRSWTRRRTEGWKAQ